MTFAALAHTLHIVIYSQLRTLISMLIVLALAIVFVWGGSRVLNSVTNAAPPLPSPTIRPAIEQPTAAPTATPRQKASLTQTTKPKPTPRPTSIPRPTATPNTPPKVFMVAHESDTAPTSVFHLSQGLNRLWCRVRNSALPPGTGTLTFYWTKDEPNGFLYQFPLPPQSGTYTDAWYAYVATNTGKYRCDVIVNNQTLGSAHFSVQP